MKAHVILIGRRLPDSEHLGIGYLLAALERAGLGGRMEALNAWTDMDGICSRVIEDAPAVVGLSIPDGGSSFLPLGMGEMLQARGYGGHVTAGGGFATLTREWLLDRHAWLDSVVRFAGEAPLVELARRVASGLDPTGIPGLTTRAGDGTPAPVMDRTQVEIEPARGELPEILGHAAAHMAATRGCPGRCDYCGPAALQRQERREGEEAGIEPGLLACSGVGGTRRRSLESILDEMAGLWHDRDVRYFYFVDEHVLPRRQGEALDCIAAWKRGLRERRVGPLGIGCMLRADRISPAIVDAFVDLGLVRCFVGLELATREELRLYRRGGDPDGSLGIMRRLVEAGAATIGNLMLVHPYSTAESIERGISFLETMGHVPFEATEMQVYHGTRLEERLRAEGRLTGNPVRHGYVPVEPAAGRFREIFARLRAEVFHDYSLAFEAHDLMLALALASRLGDGSGSTVELDGIQRDLNSLRTGAFSRALELALSGLGHEAAGRLVDETRIGAMEISRRIGIATRALSTRTARRRLFAPMRAAAAAAATFVLASGCKGPTQPPAESPEPVVVEATTEPAPVDASIDADVASEVAVDAGIAEATEVWTSLPACAMEKTAASMKKTMAARKKAEKLIHRVEPCATFYVSIPCSIDEATIGSIGNDYETAYCTPPAIDADAIKKELSGGLTAGEKALILGSPVYAAGKDRKDKALIWSKVSKGCPGVAGSSDWHALRIEVGKDGKVVDVRANSASTAVSPQAVECVKKVLSGLVFPCLAGQAICPEWVIVE